MCIVCLPAAKPWRHMTTGVGRSVVALVLASVVSRSQKADLADAGAVAEEAVGPSIGGVGSRIPVADRGAAENLAHAISLPTTGSHAPQTADRPWGVHGVSSLVVSSPPKMGDCGHLPVTNADHSSHFESIDQHQDQAEVADGDKDGLADADQCSHPDIIDQALDQSEVADGDKDAAYLAVAAADQSSHLDRVDQALDQSDIAVGVKDTGHLAAAVADQSSDLDRVDEALDQLEVADGDKDTGNVAVGVADQRSHLDRFDEAPDQSEVAYGDKDAGDLAVTIADQSSHLDSIDQALDQSEVAVGDKDTGHLAAAVADQSSHLDRLDETPDQSDVSVGDKDTGDLAVTAADQTTHLDSIDQALDQLEVTDSDKEASAVLPVHPNTIGPAPPPTGKACGVVAMGAGRTVSPQEVVRTGGCAFVVPAARSDSDSHGADAASRVPAGLGRLTCFFYTFDVFCSAHQHSCSFCSPEHEWPNPFSI